MHKLTIKFETESNKFTELFEWLVSLDSQNTLVPSGSFPALAYAMGFDGRWILRDIKFTVTDGEITEYNLEFKDYRDAVECKLRFG